MVNEAYIQFDTARLLKAAGFPQDDCLYKAYDSDGDLYARMWEVESECYAAPSQAQAMRWLREENRINVRINYFASAEEWFYDILSLATNEYRDSEFYYPTYEAAAEAGIRAACEYLKNNETGRT